MCDTVSSYSDYSLNVNWNSDYDVNVNNVNRLNQNPNLGGLLRQYFPTQTTSGNGVVCYFNERIHPPSILPISSSMVCISMYCLCFNESVSYASRMRSFNKSDFAPACCNRFNRVCFSAVLAAIICSISFRAVF